MVLAYSAELSEATINILGNDKQTEREKGERGQNDRADFLRTLRLLGVSER